MRDQRLGDALRRWRDRIAPEAVGIPVGPGRRSRGLRREELASLAGISVDYLTRLEQGWAAHPSDQVVGSLVRALRLSDIDRAHLFQLAGLAVPGPHVVPTHIPDSVHRMVDRLGETPVTVFDAAWNLLRANDAYTALMDDPRARHGRERNALWWNFVGPRIPTLETDEERAEVEAAMVGDLRVTAARYPEDPNLRRLVADLEEASPRFRELWALGGTSRHDSARKVIDHPRVGEIAFDCDLLTVADSDLRILVYTAKPGSEDADRLRLATVVGTREREDRELVGEG